MGVERQIPCDLQALYGAAEVVCKKLVDKKPKSQILFWALEFVAAVERIADLAAEVAEMKRQRDVLLELDVHKYIERLKGLLREWSHLGAALITGARMPRTIEELAERTDQQLQPTQAMLPNPNRQGTPHEYPHERTLACSAPPKCQQLQPKGEQG